MRILRWWASIKLFLQVQKKHSRPQNSLNEAMELKNRETGIVNYSRPRCWKRETRNRFIRNIIVSVMSWMFDDVSLLARIAHDSSSLLPSLTSKTLISFLRLISSAKFSAFLPRNCTASDGFSKWSDRILIECWLQVVRFTISPLQNFPPSKFTMSPIKFSTWKVRLTLLQLDTSKSKGPDGIPAIVLKTCAPELAPILNKLLQFSYTLGTFPTSWKLPNVLTISKKATSLIHSTIVPFQSLNSYLKQWRP